jgi:hypothetical protein
MWKWLILVTAVWACSPAPTPAPEPAPVFVDVDGACAASATTTWAGGGGTSFAIEGQSAGDDCAAAPVTLTIRAADGAVAFEESHQSDHVMTLAGAESIDDMRRRLGEWITPAGAQMDSTGDLPEWVQGAHYPVSEEFPFYPEDGVTRETYEALRAEDRVMYCYVQGMESIACLVVRDGALAKIGVQSFPS